MKRLVVTVSLLLLGSPALALDQVDGKWYEDGREVPNTEWRSSNGAFLAMLLFTSDAEALYRDWNSKALPKVTGIESIGPGKHFEAIIVFVNCKANDKGECRVSSDWKIGTADGRSLGKADDVPTWIDRRAGASGEFMIAEHGVGMVSEANFEGTYVFVVEVMDEVSGRSVRLKRGIAIKASAD